MAADEIKEIRVVAPWAAKGMGACPVRLYFQPYGLFAKAGPRWMTTASWLASWPSPGAWRQTTWTWTFKIRQGVKFHDGTPLTAEWVAKCLNRARKAKSILGKGAGGINPG